MHISAIFPIDNLSLPTRNFTVPFLGHFLSNDFNAALKMFPNPQSLVNNLGGLMISFLKSERISFFVFNIQDKNIEHSENSMDFTTKALASDTQFTVDCLWHIIDNSCHTRSAYFQSMQNPNRVYVLWGNQFHSNCLGTKSAITLNSEQISKWADSLKTYNNLAPNFNAADILRNVTTVSGDIDKGNRIQRSYFFLSAARNASYLPAKIASYMSCLECLFAPDGQEISHRVSERVAFFLGKNSTDIKSIYQTVSLSYKIRSKYVHGSHISFDPQTYAIPSLPRDLDKVIRNVYNKLFSSDNKIFTGKDEDLRVYLQNLIFPKP